MISQSEENYLKSLYTLAQSDSNGEVSSMELATYLQVRAASVTEMLRKLRSKNYVEYEKYGKIKLTDCGLKTAVNIVRKHRLWETFLYEKLKFDSGAVHEVAEELEHIKSDLLINRLEEFLDFPTHDPHGEPIPPKEITAVISPKVPISRLEVNASGTIAPITDLSPELQDYLSSLGISAHQKVTVIKRFPYDSQTCLLTGGRHIFISKKLADEVLVYQN